MPADINHINQAKHNFQFLESFYNTFNYNDWSITVAFYAAVHIVEMAIFRQKNLLYLGNKIVIQDSDRLQSEITKNRLPLPSNCPSAIPIHTARNIIVAENFDAIWGWFDLLYKNSKAARYRQYSWDKFKTQLLVETPTKGIIDRKSVV